MAAKNTNKTTRDLFAQSLAGAPTEILGQMPMRTAMRSERKVYLPKAPKNLVDLVLLEVRTTTGANFLLHDNGPKEKERIIIFATNEALDFLTQCDYVLMDGTVKSSPALFNQMYTIHGTLQ